MSNNAPERPGLSGDGSGADRRTYLIGLAAIVALGAALRLARLGAQGFWLDEAAQLRTAERIGSHGLSAVADKERVAPLSHVVDWLATSAFGDSATVLRAPAALAGIASIVLIAELGRRLYTPSVGLLAAGLLAISPFAVWLAQDGRMYGPLVCATLAILLLYVRAIERPERVGRWAGLGVVTALGLWTHQYAALTMAACGVHLLLTHSWKESVTRRWLVVQAAAAITLVPWILMTSGQQVGTVGGEKANQILWLPYALYAFFAGFSLGPSIRALQIEGGASALRDHLLVVGLLAITVAGLVVAAVWAMHTKGRRSSNVLIVSACAVPLGIAVAAPMVFDWLTFNVRYAAMALPPLLIGISTIALDRRHRAVHVALGTSLVVLAAWSLWGWYTDDEYAKERLEQIGPYLAREAQPGDTVYVSSWTLEDPVDTFGYDGPVVPVKPEDLDEIVDGLRTNPPTGRVWLVESREWESDPDHRVRAALDDVAQLQSERSWPGVLIREYGPAG